MIHVSVESKEEIITISLLLKNNLLNRKICDRMISLKAIWFLTRTENLCIVAGLTTNMIANVGKNKGISMVTLAKI